MTWVALNKEQSQVRDILQQMTLNHEQIGDPVGKTINFIVQLNVMRFCHSGHRRSTS